MTGGLKTKGKEKIEQPVDMVAVYKIKKARAGLNQVVATNGYSAWYLRTNPGRFVNLNTFIMKKLQNLGKSLSKAEQKAILGGTGNGDACSATPQFCNTASCNCGANPGKLNVCFSGFLFATCTCDGYETEISCN